ncbi:hypothetical protein OH687_10075 [Burkholderia anthina]|nr:hypothetical protein OH687_10075 [Burkholderia anthina]
MLRRLGDASTGPEPAPILPKGLFRWVKDRVLRDRSVT